MDELIKLIELLAEDAPTENPRALIRDYIAPILESMASEIDDTQTAIQSVAELSQLALLTSQRTYVGEILRQVAENFAILLQSEVIPKEGAVADAVSEIDSLLGSWMELEQTFEVDNLNDIDDEEEDEEEDEEDDEEEDVEDDEEGAPPTLEVVEKEEDKVVVTQEKKNA